MSRAEVLALASALMLAGCEQRTTIIDVRAHDGSCVRVLRSGSDISDIRTVREQGDKEQDDDEWFPCRLPPSQKG